MTTALVIAFWGEATTRTPTIAPTWKSHAGW
jgi:hypothetical protein